MKHTNQEVKEAGFKEGFEAGGFNLSTDSIDCCFLPKEQQRIYSHSYIDGRKAWAEKHGLRWPLVVGSFSTSYAKME